MHPYYMYTKCGRVGLTMARSGSLRESERALSHVFFMTKCEFLVLGCMQSTETARSESRRRPERADFQSP
jgi:hypothetical protein